MSILPDTNAGNALAVLLGTRNISEHVLQSIPLTESDPQIYIIIDSDAIGPAMGYTTQAINTFERGVFPGTVGVRNIKALDIRNHVNEFRILSIPTPVILVLNHLYFIDTNTWLKLERLTRHISQWTIENNETLVHTQSSKRYNLTDRSDIKDKHVYTIELFKYAREIESTLEEFRAWWQSRNDTDRLTEYWNWEYRKIISDFVSNARYNPSILYNIQTMITNLRGIARRQLKQHQLGTSVQRYMAYGTSKTPILRYSETEEYTRSGTIGLPAELIYTILFNMSYEDILSYCQTSTEARSICDDRQFWITKLDHDFTENMVPSSYVDPDDIDGKAIYGRFYKIFHLRHTYGMIDALDRGYIDVALWLYESRYPMILIYGYMVNGVRMIHNLLMDFAPYTNLNYEYDKLEKSDLQHIAQLLTQVKPITPVRFHLIRDILRDDIDMGTLKLNIWSYLLFNNMIRRS